MLFEPTIGLEVHAELQTETKMFCSCPVVDTTSALPNTAVCPVCAGMPGVLPVVNRRAVDYALRVALALKCEISPSSIFARKNYFYPDLPKGYQISQYEQPLARNGQLTILTSQGERVVRIRRVHLEEDTGKLTHLSRDGEKFSLVDLNRAGVPLLEIVTEPDLHSPEEVRACAMSLRSHLRYLGVNSGDMQKGVLRIEPNISIHPLSGADGQVAPLGTRVEIKNLNSFRALERSVAYEIQRQTELLQKGGRVVQQTAGWDDNREVTFPQRIKETEEDYRYFPEPDLPPLMVDPDWIDRVRATLPELPLEKMRRFQRQYGLNAYDSGVLVAERGVADYFEQAVAAAAGVAPKMIANWISGELFGLLNQAGLGIEAARVSPQALAGLLQMLSRGEINQNTAKSVLVEMFHSGEGAEKIVIARGLGQISETSQVAALVEQILEANPQQVADFLGGKQAVGRWLFGQVMRAAQGRANPQVVQQELDRQLRARSENR